MLLKCGVGEDSWEFLGLQGDPTSPSKVNWSWVFTGRTDVKAETPVFWPPDAKSWIIWKDPDGKDGLNKGQKWYGPNRSRRLKERLKAGGEGDNGGWDSWMASLTQWTWFWVNLGVGDVQGGLVCYSPWGRKESDTAELLNWLIDSLLPLHPFIRPRW